MYKRYRDEGLEGLKARLRIRKLSVVSDETKEKIKQEVSNSNTGRETNEIMIIQKKIVVKYHEVHIRRLLHKGVFIKGPTEKIYQKIIRKKKNSF